MVAGLLAGRVIPGRGFGLAGNLIVSNFGALVGGYFYNAWVPPGRGGMLGAILLATLGSVIFLGIVGWLSSLARDPEGRHQE